MNHLNNKAWAASALALRGLQPPHSSVSSRTARRICREYTAGYCPSGAQLPGICILHLHQFQEFLAAGAIEFALGIEPRGGLQF